MSPKQQLLSLLSIMVIGGLIVGGVIIYIKTKS